LNSACVPVNAAMATSSVPSPSTSARTGDIGVPSPASGIASAATDPAATVRGFSLSQARKGNT